MTLALQRPGPFTQADIGEVESLALISPRDISGLDQFTRLLALRLDGYPGRDLAPLAGHRALAAITVKHSAVATIDALATVPTLKRVRLPNNVVGDVSALRALPLLREVVVTGNPLGDDSYHTIVPELKERVEAVTVSDERAWRITRRLHAAGIPFAYFRTSTDYRLCRPGLDYTPTPYANHPVIGPDELEALLDRDPAEVHTLFAG
ncbi:hypothetical protein [Actinokineospora globicatena]|uniref:hypothetical protein n=1 Tax=Actinokineospora globicatena TaxID=103729 RepID=UPI0020A39542|nr:hypothetical protein [Actinokineospora globicatena]